MRLWRKSPFFTSVLFLSLPFSILNVWEIWKFLDLVKIGWKWLTECNTQEIGFGFDELLLLTIECSRNCSKVSEYFNKRHISGSLHKRETSFSKLCFSYRKGKRYGVLLSGIGTITHTVLIKALCISVWVWVYMGENYFTEEVGKCMVSSSYLVLYYHHIQQQNIMRPQIY